MILNTSFYQENFKNPQEQMFDLLYEHRVIGD